MKRWFLFLFRRRKVEEQLHAELSFHLEQQTRAYRASGMAPDEARRTALLDFGGLDQMKEECRDSRGTRLIEDVELPAARICSAP